MAQNNFEGRIGFAGGYFAGWNLTDFDKLNSFVNLHDSQKFSRNGFYFHGGGGYVYIMIIPNLRVGGIGMSGSQSISSRISSGTVQKIEYHQSFGGLSVEYTTSLSSVNISFGGIIGIGETKLHLKNLIPNSDWNDIWKNFGDTISINQNYSNLLTTTYFTFIPTMNIEYSLNRFTALRFGCGYAFNFARDWYINESEKVNSVPSAIIRSSFYLTGGILIGFFSN
ncbi:MAG: hypothetical protein FJ213_03165 [Ignavibacteria bacterium]|nr:hypothetical protein [Ignavibacteria bacterium]